MKVRRSHWHENGVHVRKWSKVYFKKKIVSVDLVALNFNILPFRIGTLIFLDIMREFTYLYSIDYN